MDISQLILAVPNLVIAVWVIWTLQQQNNVLQKQLLRLIDKFMDLHPPQSEKAAEAIAEKKVK